MNAGAGGGSASLQYPVSGPKGSGTVTVEATESGGQWSFNQLTETIENTGQVIDLLAE